MLAERACRLEQRRRPLVAEHQLRDQRAVGPSEPVADCVAARAEALPYEAGSFDCVVCTFTLCSVQDPAATLAEARRVLKPGGRFIFCEHGLAPDADVVKWQRRIEPFWTPFAGGCHLTRAVATSIEAAGFQLTRLEKMYLPKTPRVLGWNEWGEATPA